MRNISELFEFLSNCDKETIITELYDHCDRIIQKNGTKSERPFKFEVENLHTLFRLSEWYQEKELPRMIEEQNPKRKGDEIMTVEEVGLYMKITPATVYNLINLMENLKILIPISSTFFLFLRYEP
jgi:hypothetical protein